MSPRTAIQRRLSFFHAVCRMYRKMSTDAACLNGALTEIPRRVSRLCVDAAAGRAARHRVRAAGPDRPRLPRLHRRRPVRRVAAAGPPGAARATACSATPTPASPTVGGQHGAGRPRAPTCSATSTPRRTSTPSSSRANASGALKLVGEAYPFGPRRPLPAHRRQPQLGQRHPRVRPGAGRRGHLRPADAARPAPGRRPLLDRTSTGRAAGREPVRLSRRSPTSPACSIRWTGSSGRRRGAGTCCWTPPPSRRRNRLDLGRRQPDFVALSFYKMFGYPTGVGCLIARRAALARLRRPWFAGGTIDVASVRAGRHSLAEGEAGVRGRHGQLPGPARGRDRPAAPRVDRHRDRSTSACAA